MLSLHNSDRWGWDHTSSDRWNGEDAAEGWLNYACNTLAIVSVRMLCVPEYRNEGILLANSEAPTCRLTHDPSEGPEAWSTPCGHLGFVSGEIGSPTVSGRFSRQCYADSIAPVISCTDNGCFADTCAAAWVRPCDTRAGAEGRPLQAFVRHRSSQVPDPTHSLRVGISPGSASPTLIG